LRKKRTWEANTGGPSEVQKEPRRREKISGLVGGVEHRESFGHGLTGSGGILPGIGGGLCPEGGSVTKF